MEEAQVGETSGRKYERLHPVEALALINRDADMRHGRSNVLVLNVAASCTQSEIGIVFPKCDVSIYS